MAHPDTAHRKQLIARLKSAIATAAVVGTLGGWLAFGNQQASTAVATTDTTVPAVAQSAATNSTAAANSTANSTTAATTSSAAANSTTAAAATTSSAAQSSTATQASTSSAPTSRQRAVTSTRSSR